MEKIKELQLQALDELGKRVASMDMTLNRIEHMTNPFDIEAALFLLAGIAEHVRKRAREIHKEMHAANSRPGEPHLGACTAERINMELLEESLRQTGWTMNATEFVLNAVKEKNHG